MHGTWPWNRRDHSAGSFELEQDATLRVRPRGYGVVIRAEGGLVLVTQAGDPEDHVLAPGDELRLPRGGLVVAQAFAASRLVVCAASAPERPVRRGTGAPALT